MKWIEALPFVLMSIRASVNRSTGFSPFELCTGRKMPGPASISPGSEPLDLTAINHTSFFCSLTTLVASLSSQVHQQAKQQKKAREPPAGQVAETADWVWLKVIKRKWTEPRWTGPFQVVSTTSHSVKLQGKGDTWFHFNQCAPADPPSRSLQEVRSDLRQQTDE